MAHSAFLTLRDTLLRHRNGDGGWGYTPGKSSRLEPTCWSLLAIARSANRVLDPTEIAVLTRWKRQDGWLVDVPRAPINYAFNALAALALRTHPEGKAGARQLATQLINVRGMRFDQGKEIRQDNSLQAWPWIDSTFSWVEPTSLCLVLLKKLRPELPGPATKDRIDIGERMLLDRACSVGGWNYGGSNVYGQELFPYVPTTALGLLALQDRPREPAVARALAWIQKEAHTEPTAQALALAVIALGVHRVAAPAVEKALQAHMEASLDGVGIVGLAAGLYALSRSSHVESAFAI